ncbi:OmpW/AlkL family protein [Niveispirillum sp. KHB5.9]|uniref:OmpW/AlkL family protein n=1 Tax=Niveispirillum sp. KHB5.9 TaxID=3400269 RepID=UPI003A8C4662
MKKFAVPALAAALTIGAAAAVPALAEKAAGDLLVRGRIIHVKPDESSDLKLGTTGIAGHAAVSNSTVPELDFSYFFTDNIAAELILGTTHHDVAAKGSPLGASVDLGDVWLLPPTVTVQYHFNPKGKVSPYIGAGVNYTIFYGDDPGAALGIDYDNSFGLAAQAGVDFALTDKWSLNLDVKKLWLNTDVKVNAGLVSPVNAKVDLDPWIFGVGVGYRF